MLEPVVQLWAMCVDGLSREERRAGMGTRALGSEQAKMLAGGASKQQQTPSLILVLSTLFSQGNTPRRERNNDAISKRNKLLLCIGETHDIYHHKPTTVQKRR